MKVGLSEQTARKALALIPCTTNDQDLIQLRERLEAGLAAVTAAGHLTQMELSALIWAAAHFITDVTKNADPSNAAKNAAEQLKTAGPKLEALKARRKLEGGV